MDDPDIPELTDLSEQSDLALYTAARDGSDAARDELQQRYLHALRTVAAGYRGGDPDRDGLIDRIFADLADAPIPDAEGAVPITLFTLVREEKLDSTERHGPIGLVDLAGPSIHRRARNCDGRGSGASPRAPRRLRRPRPARPGAALVLRGRRRAPRSLSSRLSIGGADAASAKAFRARSNLRRAYAERRATSAGRTPACIALADDLVRWADGDLPPSFDDGPRGAHLAGCDHCRKVLAELHQINGGLLVEAAATRRAMVGAPQATAVPVTAAVPAAAAFGAPLPTDPDEPTDTIADLDTTGDPDAGNGRSRAVAVLLVAALLAVALGGFAFWRARNDSNDSQVQAGDTQDSPLTQSVATSTRQSVSIAPVHTASSTTSTTSTTTTTTTRSSGTRPSTGSGGTSGAWTDPGTVGTTAAPKPPTTVARTTAPPATTTPPTTTATTVTTTPTTVSPTTDTP